jgi:hypothetical protein
MRPRADLVGQVFGKWRVLAYAGYSDAAKNSMWLCACECGRSTVVRVDGLRRGTSKSCGCGRTTNNYKHGHAHAGHITPQYREWAKLVARAKREATRCPPNWIGPGGFQVWLAEQPRRPLGEKNAVRS